MDEMTTLRRMRAQISRPAPDRLTTGRDRLQAAIDQETSARRTASNRPDTGGTVNDIHITRDPAQDKRGLLRRRPVLGAVLAATAAVAVTATVVVADNIGDRQGSSSPSVSDTADTRRADAKKVLHGAAQQARKGPESQVPRDDQFVYTKNVTKETDRRTGKSKTYTDESWKSVDLSQRSWEESLGEGNWSEPLKENEGIWPHYDWKELKKLPTDPTKLILAVRKPMGPPVKAKSLDDVRKPEWSDIHHELSALVTAAPVMPKDLRAAALDGLAMVPGTRAETGVKDVEGRPGIAISSKNALFKDSVLIFDESSYEFLGHTGVRSPGKKTYDQVSQLADYAVVDKVKQRP